MVAAIGIIRCFAYYMLIGITGLLRSAHSLVICCQCVIDGSIFRIKTEHLVSNGEGLVIPSHVKVKAGKFGIAGCVAWAFVNMSFLCHNATQLLVHPLTYVTQVIGGLGIFPVADPALG